MARKYPRCALCGNALPRPGHLLFERTDFPGRPLVGWCFRGGRDCYRADPAWAAAFPEPRPARDTDAAARARHDALFRAIQARGTDRVTAGVAWWRQFWDTRPEGRAQS